MMTAGRGRVVAISSGVSKLGEKEAAPYVASKFGLVGLSKTAALEAARPTVCFWCLDLRVDFALFSNGRRQFSELGLPGDFMDLHSLVMKRLDHSVMAISECDLAAGCASWWRTCRWTGRCYRTSSGEPKVGVAKALRPGRKRELVNGCRSDWGVSIRRACRVLEMDTSSYHYRSRRPNQAGLESRIKAMCQTRVRYGYRRIHVLLQREGWRLKPTPTASPWTSPAPASRRTTPSSKPSTAATAPSA